MLHSWQMRVLGGIGWFYAENSPPQTRDEPTQVSAPPRSVSPPEDVGSRKNTKVEPSALPVTNETKAQAEPLPSRDVIPPAVQNRETQTSAVDPRPDLNPEPAIASAPENERRHGTMPELDPRSDNGPDSQQGTLAPEELSPERSSAAPPPNASEELTPNASEETQPIEDGQPVAVEPSVTPDAANDMSAVSPPVATAALPQAAIQEEPEASGNVQEVPPLPPRKPSFNARGQTPDSSPTPGQYSQVTGSRADNRARSLTPKKAAQETGPRLVSDLLAGGL